jgi:hypothetical protein
MWPWRNPRFLVPLIPYILLFLFLGVAIISEWMATHWGRAPARVIQGIAASLLLIHFARVYAKVAPFEHASTRPGYVQGRTRDEAGFYAACAWLKQQEPGTIVMGRPAYLLHLYSLHPTTQIEPTSNPRAQEKAYIVPNHVRYLVLDVWPWAHTERYLGPYTQVYGQKWTLAWIDPMGSGVRVYRRRDLLGAHP